MLRVSSSSKSFLKQLRSARNIHVSRSVLKAEFFRMPAMSPTMEKGGVNDWKFKEGDSFNSGDVLLEVETDKAQIDVEAQDDGVVAKILIQNGATDIPVGTPIAILAEPGDDLATLELPKVEGETAAASTPEPVKEEPKKEESQPKKQSAPVEANSSKANEKQVFFPSVASLLSENNISREDAISKISATGPNGRIVKGDVLAFLGKISQDSVNKVSAFIQNNSKLDLSNIEKLKITPKEAPKPSSSSSSPKAESEKDSKPAKPAKKQPKTITRTFNLEHLLTLQAEAPEKGLKPFTIKSYIEGASKRAEKYAYQTHAQNSDYYDPIFESLLVPDGQADRFSISLDIPTESKTVPKLVDPLDAIDFFGSKSDDLFDLPTTQNHEFTVTLTTNPKVADSEEKSELYLKRLEHYIYHF